MDWVEMYKELRKWENAQREIQKSKEELRQYDEGVKEVINKDKWSLDEITVDSRREELLETIKVMKQQQINSQEILNKYNIDAEYIVTNVYNNLRRSVQVYYYQIQEVRTPNKNYEYVIYNTKGNIEEIHNDLMRAIEQICSWYDYLKDRKPASYYYEEFYRYEKI